MNWKKWTVITVIMLFVAANFYLIFKKDSEVARSTYINKWSAVKEQHLILSKEKKGVVIPAEEEYAYLSGDFEQFFVKEGEAVEPGTPLFEYAPKNLEASIEEYEAEITKLELEQEALEDQITNLEGIVASLAKPPSNEDKTSNEAVSSLIETQIYEKETELSRVEGEIGKLEEIISGSNRSFTVDSAISGVVKEISPDLQNPVVTITSSEQLVQGLLEEKDLLEIEEEMKVVIISNVGKLEGQIASVAKNPEENPEVSKKSQYQFTVEFNEQEDIQFFAGTHVDLRIITKEVENALTLAKSTVKSGSIYVLGANGKIQKRPVETGIKIGKIFEITNNVNEGELVVQHPGNMKNNAMFFTPVELGKMKKSSLQELGKKEILRYIGRGLLKR